MTRKKPTATGPADAARQDQEDQTPVKTDAQDIEPEVRVDADDADTSAPIEATADTQETPPEADPTAELQDRYMRLLAEFDNYKKRTARDWQHRVQSAAADLLLELLEIADNFERALTAEHKDDAYAHGVQMIYDQFSALLQRQGVSDLPALGEPFDPTIHEALMHVASEDYDEGVVCQVIRRGYRLYDRVLRPAQVAVSRGPDADSAGTGDSH